MSKKLNLKDVKRPDTFQEWMMTIGEFIVANLQYIILAVIVLMIGGVSAVVVNWRHNAREARAQDALYVAEKAYFQKYDQFAQAQAQTKTPDKMPQKSAKNLPKVVGPTGHMETDYGAEIQGLKNVIARHRGTHAAVVAALDLTQIYGDYQQPKQAIAQLMAVRHFVSPSSLLYGILMMRMANFQSMSGQCSLAIQAWAKVRAQKDLSYFHPEATLRSGLCFESLSQLQKAKELYERTQDQYPGTMAARSAQQFLRLLSMKTLTHDQG